MGGKRTRQRKLLLFLVTSSIGLCLGVCNCSSLKGPWGNMASTESQRFSGQGEGRLARAKALLGRGRYNDALKDAEQVLNAQPQSLGDEALFLIGLIYSNPGNPEQDYQKSLEHFQRLITKFPSSKMRRQADLMLIYVGELMKTKTRLRKLGKKKGQLEKAIAKEKAKGRELKKEVDGCQAELQKLRDQLEKLKEIDLVIEEKKKQAK